MVALGYVVRFSTLCNYRVFWTGIYLHCYVFEKKNYGSVLFEYWANNDVVQKALHVRKVCTRFE